MTTATNNDAPVDFRLSGPAKAAIEEAATRCGQTVSEFAITTLLERAKQVLEANWSRTLSERDALIFLSVLDNEQANPALREAATWYKENYGGSVAD